MEYRQHNNRTDYGDYSYLLYTPINLNYCVPALTHKFLVCLINQFGISLQHFKL